MTSVSSLVEDLKRISLSYQESKGIVEERDSKLSDNRKKACDELFDELKNLIPDKVREYAKYGRKEARIFEFKFKDGLKRDGCFVKDLLTKGDVIPRLQSFLDTEHSDEAGPAFFIYFSHIGRYQKEHDENKFGVFVNWDKDAWANIKERLAVKPIRGRPFPSQDFAPHGGMTRGGMGRGRGRGGMGRGRGRGGMGMSRASTNETSDTAPASAPAPVDELPEKHDD